MNKIAKSLFVTVAAAFMAFGSTGAYLSDAVTVSGNQLSAGSWQTPSARIIINEVYYDGSAEWIELYNAGNATADIKNWNICDNANHCGVLNPNQKTDLLPGSFVVVSHSASDLNGWSIPSTTEKIYYSGSRIAFNDDGDSVKLSDGSGLTIDQMSYGSDVSIFKLKGVPDKHSLTRGTLGVDTDTAADFIDNASPTPGA